MGWRGRDWYLADHGPALFDAAGNAGPTVWSDGRIVGGWRQDDNGRIEVRLLEDVGREANRRIEEEAVGLEQWVGGARVTIRSPAPLWSI